MYTIKQAARLTGVSESSLRAWERRYGVVAPHRSETGYRLYDAASLAAVSRMRHLVAAGWSTAEAARAVRSGEVPATYDEAVALPIPEPTGDGAAYRQEFLEAAAQMDVAGLEESLDHGWALGSFEQVAESWLFPTLEALGEGWARGEIDVAGEHAASHAVHRRLSAAFDAAGSRSRGPSVVVGLPPSARHELGALAFATAIRRRGLDVLYLGADVPVNSWQAAVRHHAPRAAVLGVVMADDRRPAVSVAERLQADDARLLVACGGASSADLATGVRTLAPSIGAAAEQLDELLEDQSAA
jgi:DNA-binding transcriptional MerR regulator/methylmalonyl-CoA mutase cobalamin-binding subunit